eukprot:gene5909-5978_t
MITEVDTEARAEDLASLEKRLASDIKKIETRRDNDLDSRQKKLEGDLAELEAAGEKADIKRKVRESAERELKAIRDRAQRELDRLDEVWSRFKNLKVQDLEGDEGLYREMRDRYGVYFKGDMGAAAIKARLETFDLQAEYEKLTELSQTEDFPFVDYDVTKKLLGLIVDNLAEGYPKVTVAVTLDALKSLGFYWATRAGVTIGIEDVVTPAKDKAIILAASEEVAEKVQAQYEKGLITDDERRQELIEIWTKATSDLFEARTPKGVAPIAETAGVVSFLEDAKGKKIIVTPEDGGEPVAYPITRRQKLKVEDGARVGVGQQLVVGAIDPKQVLQEAKAAVYAAYDEYDFTPFEAQGSGEAIRLDDIEVR